MIGLKNRIAESRESIPKKELRTITSEDWKNQDFDDNFQDLRLRRIGIAGSSERMLVTSCQLQFKFRKPSEFSFDKFWDVTGQQVNMHKMWNIRDRCCWS
ncbi:hypothetical protein B9Z55_014281 [Caenorhabditis nigoni]|uniref:Uncharacterized protein n=1 Tax=Caenorhabditis nigoni TaxID=1611254 RepID=A0A2G5U5C6_9PELO|nr:hypothetical protein B9Z55_014281 [Caenorhabditis nigoni]